MADGTRQAKFDEILAKMNSMQENHTMMIDKQNQTIDLLTNSMKELVIGLHTLDAKIAQQLRRNSPLPPEQSVQSPFQSHPTTTWTETQTDPTLPLKSMRLEVPRFAGDNPSAWISRIQRYFDFYKTPDPQRLLIASFHLDGAALDWYDWMHKNQLIPNWHEFLVAIEKRFGPSDYEDSFGQPFWIYKPLFSSLFSSFIIQCGTIVTVNLLLTHSCRSDVPW